MTTKRTPAAQAAAEEIPSAEPMIGLKEWAAQNIPVWGYEITMAFAREYPRSSGRRTELDAEFAKFRDRPVSG